VFESIYCDAFLGSVLNGDAALIASDALNGKHAYNSLAPPGAPAPRIIYNVQAGGDVNTLNATRLFTRPLYQVRLVAKVVNGVLQDASRVRKSANRMDELLSSIRRQSFTVEGVTLNFNVWREDEIPMRVEEGEAADVTYRNYGGLYRVEAFI
jgi:hypothetical protein